MHGGLAEREMQKTISWKSGNSRQRDHKWFDKESKDSKSSLNKELKLVKKDAITPEEYNKARSERRKLIDRKKRNKGRGTGRSQEGQNREEVLETGQ